MREKGIYPYFHALESRQDVEVIMEGKRRIMLGSNNYLGLTAQPGDIRTGFTDARRKCGTGDEVYGGRIARSVAGMERDEQKGMSPEAAGRYIAKIALKRRVKPVYTVGFGYKFLSVLCRVLPCGLRNWIVGLLYAR